MSIVNRSVWQAGFRPFFILAFVAGALMPVVWALLFSGKLLPFNTQFSTLQWHVHEMFYGFAWAVLAGFLLTSTKNWVKIRGYHGWSLLVLAVAWCIERAGMWYADVLPSLLFYLSNYLFLSLIVSMLVFTLLWYRKQDSYAGDNYLFVFALPLFLVAKYLLLSPNHFQEGWVMSLALFRLCFLIMLERTLSPFMKGAFGVEIVQSRPLNLSIKLLAFVLVFEPWLPDLLVIALMVALAILLLWRFGLWSPHLGLSRIDIAVMFVGYIAISVQLLMAAAIQLGWITLDISLAAHVFTIGTIGVIAPAMMVRIANGHTGRKVSFDVWDKTILWLMCLAFVLRIVATQVIEHFYTLWVLVTALLWFLAFAMYGWRYFPYLIAPRVDGKEH